MDDEVDLCSAVDPQVRIGFVSTNSITQGEQVAQLWPILFDRYGLEISFAHRTFAWGSDARGKAHVHVVIIGLTHRDHEPREKRLFSYDDINGEPDESRHAALTAYLFDAGSVTNKHLIVAETTTAISRRPLISFGSMPNDGGNLIIGESDRSRLIEQNAEASDFIKRLIGARDFLGWKLSILPMAIIR